MNPFAHRTICLLVTSWVLLAVTSTLAQPDPLDVGNPDTLYVVLSQPRLGFDDTTLTAVLYFSNDAQPIAGLAVGLQWDNSSLRLDSAVLSPEANALGGFFQYLYYKDDPDSSNAYSRCQLALLANPGEQLAASDQPRPAVTYYFGLTQWAAGDEACFDRVVSMGAAMIDPDAGEYAVGWGGAVCCEAGADDDADGRGDLWDNCPTTHNPDQADFDLDGIGDLCDPDADGDTIADVEDNCLFLFNPLQEDDDEDGIGNPCDLSCCHGTVGNANGSAEEEPTISDIAAIVAMLFLDLQPVVCLPEADLNQSGGTSPTAEDITVQDISVLVDYMFITGSDLRLNDCL